MTTSFPCVRDWTLAVQLPSVRFRGTPLAQLTVERRPGGLVQVERGTFCYTFKIRLQGRIQALRCPHMPAPHREDRLEALMRFFQAHPCPHFVPFQVYRNAASLPGFPQPFSVTGMDWVEGQALDDWFNAHLGDARTLQAMADRWLALMRDLQRLGIAHGDLQHGNILIRNGVPVLVDYDTCWAPTTARWPSDEVGHPNYAHPGRTPDLYGPQMDAFSGLSIHLSLLAAARMPDLAHDAAQAGRMDQLLLSRHDYLQPDASVRFQRMLAAADPEVSQRAAQLRSMCLADAASIRYDWNRCALAGSTALPATSGAGTWAKSPLQGTGAPMIPASTPAWLVRARAAASPATTAPASVAGVQPAHPTPAPGSRRLPVPAWLCRSHATLVAPTPGWHRPPASLHRKTTFVAGGTTMKRLVMPTRHRLALPFATALLSLLLLLALTSAPVLGATYLAALQRAVVHGRSTITLPVWTREQAAGLDTLCRWYGQTLGLDIRMVEPSEGTAIAPPLRTVRLPDPSAQGALRLQATGEAELEAALGLLQQFTASEAYILYHPLAANSASLETLSDDDARAATSQPIPDASALAERLAPLLQAFAEGAANAFEQPLQSLSWRLVPALQLVPAPRSDTPDAEGSAPARSTHTLTVAGTSTKAVWLHLNYQFAPLSEAGQLQVLDARATQTGDPPAEATGITLSGDSSSAAGSSLLAGPSLPRSSALPGSPSLPRNSSRFDSLAPFRNPSASACFPEDVRRRMPMFRQADGPMVPARRTLEACGALVAYDSYTRELHWLIDGVRHAVRMNQALFLRGYTFYQLPALVRVQDGSLWMPIEALPEHDR